VGPSPEQRDEGAVLRGRRRLAGVGLVNTDYPAFIAAGRLLATVPVAIVPHALLAFPAGRLTTRPPAP